MVTKAFLREYYFNWSILFIIVDWQIRTSESDCKKLRKSIFIFFFDKSEKSMIIKFCRLKTWGQNEVLGNNASYTPRIAVKVIKNSSGTFYYLLADQDM